MSAADEMSPAERYADYRQGRRHPVFREFAGLYSFPLDDFQVRACHEIEDGRGVLVAAPTGSGKTIVGEFAIHLALATGRKCFYTTPIKALSNQKYHDLVAPLRARAGRPADRRQRRQRRGPDRGDDHRGAAQHAVRRVPHAAGPRATW